MDGSQSDGRDNQRATSVLGDKRIIESSLPFRRHCHLQRQRPAIISTPSRHFPRHLPYTQPTRVTMFAATRSTMALGLRGT
jgi:hypothetical protein